MNSTFDHYKDLISVKVVIFGVIISAFLTSCNMRTDPAKQKGSIEPIEYLLK